MPADRPPTFNDNFNANLALATFGACVLATVWTIALILMGSPESLETRGIFVYSLASLLALASFVLSLRGKSRKEEKWRWVFALVFSSTMIVSLAMILAIYLFLRTHAPEMI